MQGLFLLIEGYICKIMKNKNRVEAGRKVAEGRLRFKGQFIKQSVETRLKDIMQGSMVSPANFQKFINDDGQELKRFITNLETHAEVNSSKILKDMDNFISAGKTARYIDKDGKEYKGAKAFEKLNKYITEAKSGGAYDIRFDVKYFDVLEMVVDEREAIEDSSEEQKARNIAKYNERMKAEAEANEEEEEENEEE